MARVVPWWACMKIRDTFMVSLLVSISGCASGPEGIDEGAIELADLVSTQELEGTYCGMLTPPPDFNFRSLELSFDGGYEGRDDTGTALLVGRLSCDHGDPSVPCTRQIISADYNADGERMIFRPVSYETYDESDGQITDAVGDYEPILVDYTRNPATERLDALTILRYSLTRQDSQEECPGLHGVTFEAMAKSEGLGQ